MQVDLRADPADAGGVEGGDRGEEAGMPDELRWLDVLGRADTADFVTRTDDDRDMA